MKLSDYDFDLPQELIAQTPTPDRGQSRLMVVNRTLGTIVHETFENLHNYLGFEPLMVFNNTRVLPAKLLGIIKNSGKTMELLLVRELEPGLWTCLVKGLGKLKPGCELSFDNENFHATLINKMDGQGVFKFKGPSHSHSLLQKVGRMPLPPYIHREPPEKDDFIQLDRERYQTVFASKSGAIAAPTAGLHFSESYLKYIRENYAQILEITLHVGLGTFKNIRQENYRLHTMDKEEYTILEKDWNRLYQSRKESQRILAVGTTSTRVLESIILNGLRKSDQTGWTQIFLYPGKCFRNVNHLLTNFHLPKSTLFLLVNAFAGKRLMEQAYKKAIREKYRFFSYGDAMLIL